MKLATLSTRILQHLGVLAAGESATAEDHQLVREALTGAHAQLATRGLVPFELDEIPEWAQLPLRDYVAYQLASSYGIMGERLQMLAAEHLRGLAELRVQMAAHASALPVRARYF